MLGICVIGAGRAGMIHAKNFRSRVPKAKLVAIADPVEEAAKRASNELEIDSYYLDYTQALDDDRIDAVVIATPTKYHKDIAVAAAKAGKHILCEKPMAMNENECDEMIESAEKNKVVLQIGFMRRYDENFIRAKAIIDSGEIGDIVLIKSHTRGPSLPKPWMFDLSKSNGPLAEVNSHDIDMIRWFSGSEVDFLYSIGGIYRSLEAKAQYPDFYDNIIMNIKMKNGMIASIDGAQGVSYGYDAKAEIVGTKGVLHVGRAKDNFVTYCNKNNEIRSSHITTWSKLFQDAYLEEDISFVECILQGVPPRATGYDGKMAVKVVEAGNRSLKENRIINL